MSKKPPSVSVTIVTFNSARYIARCLDAVLRQAYRPLEVVVVDNASLDGTRLVLAEYADRIRVVQNERNVGFARGQNQAIEASTGDWVLTLNPDALLMPGFIKRLVDAAQVDDRIGSVCGKLLRIGPDFAPLKTPELDSAGIYFTPNFRHFDRGWHQTDDGQFDQTEYVFGASGAAALYRREMIADVSHPDGFFDPDFFAYREDADVSWRAQLLGWRCLFTPHAVAYHVRTVVPEVRRTLSPIINMHSVKNRFLMRIKNTTANLYTQHFFSVTGRDILVLGGCLFYELRSLPAFWHLAKCWNRAWEKRRAIMARRRVDEEYMAAWFRPEPSAQPVPELVLR